MAKDKSLNLEQEEDQQQEKETSDSLLIPIALVLLGAVLFDFLL